MDNISRIVHNDVYGSFQRVKQWIKSIFADSFQVPKFYSFIYITSWALSRICPIVAKHFAAQGDKPRIKFISIFVSSGTSFIWRNWPETEGDDSKSIFSFQFWFYCCMNESAVVCRHSTIDDYHFSFCIQTHNILKIIRDIFAQCNFPITHDIHLTQVQFPTVRDR